MIIVRELFAKLGLAVDGAAFSKADAAIGGLKRGLAAVGVTLAAGAVARGLKNLVEDTARTANETRKAAQRVGMARQAFEELGFAAESSGLPLEVMEQGLKFLNRNIYDAARGNHQLAYQFRQLGIQTTDSAGKLRGADEVLEDLAARFEGMEDGPKKTALAIHLMGRAGNQLIPFLNKGREAIQGYRAEAHELGLVFRDEDYVAAEEFRQANVRLGHAIQGVKRQIAVALVPQLTEGRKKLADWVWVNRQLIKERVVAFAENLAKVLKVLAQMLEPVVRGIALIASNGWLATAAVVGLGLALNAAFVLPTIAVLTLLALVEELWGWMTGKRATLLEDWLGPFQEFIRIDPKDSPLLNGLKEVLETISKLDEAVANLGRRWSDFKRTFGMSEAAPAAGKLADWLTGGPARRELAHAVGLDLPSIPRLEGLPPGADWRSRSVAAGALGPAPVVVQFAGDVNVGASLPAGLSPDEFVRRLGSEVVTQSDLQGILSDAYAGVTR